MMERLATRHLVLLGIGHTNAHVLRMWAMKPIPEMDLTCVSNHGVATYSGMLPAVLAGQKPRQAMEIDLVQLCAAAGARLLTDTVIGLDVRKQQLLFEQRPAVPYDLLSIGIGSTASRAGLEVTGNSLVEVKPMQTFLDRLNRTIQNAGDLAGDRPLRLVVVGGGVASVEICTCLPGLLRRAIRNRWSLTLITSGSQILPSVSNRTRQLVMKELDRRQVEVVTESRVERVTDRAVMMPGDRSIPADVVVWATGATAPRLLSELGLNQDDRGFLLTDRTLQATGAENIFAVGDTGTIAGLTLPKAGVYAVRQGPVLWDNLQRKLDDRPLREYQPQGSFLKLINLGDGRAVGQWKSLSFAGRWVMRWKDRIDSNFMKMYQPTSLSMPTTAPMQCRGCGCKLGAHSLESGLRSIDVGPPEDTAPIGGEHSSLVASTDFFTAPVADPYLAGRIAAVHAVSDILASGAEPSEALANIVLPAGAPTAQQQMLSDLMDGATEEFAAVGAKVVGGHTITGPRLELGFTVVGRLRGSKPLRKRHLKVDDRLLVTKPIGTGILLAALMRAKCRNEWYQQLINWMLMPQIEYSRIATDLGIQAATDLTGFGLAGHLIEMLEASEVSAEIALDQIPVLVGAEALVDAGVESTLMPENERIAPQIHASPAIAGRTRYRVLFDPQTCGGLLFGAPPHLAQAFRDATRSAGLPPLVDIGRVTELSQHRVQLVGSL